MNRRDFLKLQMHGALVAAAGASGLIRPDWSLAEAVTDIGVAKGGPAAATRAAVELLGGMKRFVKKGAKVVVKPNMSFSVPPERASNTHPEVVRVLVEMCREAGASRVLVLDNPLSSAERCLELSEIQAACDTVEKGMVHMVTDASLYKETNIPGGEVHKKNEVMKEVLAADVLIAAPVAKSHSGAGVSLSMKGMMGLVLDRWDMHRVGLHKSIVDLASLLKPQLAVIDATRVLSSGGPGGPGTVLKGDMVIASTDMVAADAYTVAQFEWYGRKYAPRQVPHIAEAHRRGLGRMDVENLNVKTITV
jgi:uncharacterized protein (DUF362 family)